MTPDGEAGDRRRIAVVRFARDVAINVIANLLAAAIIYLAGAAAGLLPRSPSLILSSMTFIFLAVSCVILALGLVVPRRATLLIVSLVLIAVGLSELFALFLDFSGVPMLVRILMSIGLIGMSFVTISVGIEIFRLHKPWSEAIDAADRD